ncbi:MAG: hypothetical protein WCY44_00870 [Sphaerochaetaceae bacterium]
MKKTAILITLLLLIGSTAFSLPISRDLELNTTIETEVEFTINDSPEPGPLVIDVFDTPVAVPYYLKGNTPVKLSVSSSNAVEYPTITDFRLIVAGTPANYIPYALSIDYTGGGTFTPVVLGAAPVNISHTNGVFEITSNIKVTLTGGNYTAGTYADTLTFTIAAQ